MSEINPYQTPSSDISIPGESPEELAGRWRRLVASIVDSLVIGVIVLPIMYLMGIFDYVRSGMQAPVTLMLLAAVMGFVTFVVINYIPLSKTGQTVGKKLLNIRITDLQCNKADVSTIILKRYLPVHAAGQIPIIGSIVGVIDVLLIFRADRRCLHDLIAGTQVMRVK